MTLSRNLSKLGQAVSVSGNIPSANVSGLATVATTGSASDITTGTLPSSVYTAGATGVPVLNVYTSSSTWTKPATVKAIKVTVVGGGGAGGPNYQPTGNGGGGGGGGGTAIRTYPAPSLPGPQPYTVGGTSSFGVAPVTVISATAGDGGGTGNGGIGGAGGTGTNGQANMTGSPGGTSGIGTGIGGSSSMGGGGQTGPLNGSVPGNPGRAYGGGGGGGGPGNNGPYPGGGGAAGVVIVEEFY
jgi:hypothetical protein